MQIDSSASRFRSFPDAASLAAQSAAVVVVDPAGAQTTVPLPDADPSLSPPLSILTVQVTRVLSGAVEPGPLQVVDPGDDLGTGRSALLSHGPLLLFLQPGAFGAGRPVGAHVAVGGPSGVWSSTDDGVTFRGADLQEPALRDVVLRPDDVPPAQRTDADVIARGI